jgi:hypothetical protein
MTRDPDRHNSAPAVPDDERLAQLVRTTTEGWTMPPQRLDQPTWRDRVDSPVGGRHRRSWLSRLAAPLTTAVVGTVVVAFVAVWLTTPRTGPIAGASPSAGAGTPGASAAPSDGLLPSLLVNGALPDPSSVLVEAGPAYRIVDLATGTSKPIFVPMGVQPGWTTVVARPNGGWVCICSSFVASSNGRPTKMDVTLQATDAAGRTQSADVIRSIVGHEDMGLGVAAQPELLDMNASGSPDGRYVFVGWSAKEGANGWTAGFDVVDTDTAKVVASVTLPIAEPGEADGQVTTRIAPKVELAPAGDAILVSDFWFVATDSSVVPSGNDHWTASFRDGAIGSLVPQPAASGDRCAEFDRGLVDANSTYVLCTEPGGSSKVERTGVDGTSIYSHDVPSLDPRAEGRAPVIRRGSLLYLWDPIRLRLSRIDLATGEVASTTATAAMSAGDGLTALGLEVGHWLAPPALAKTRVEPSMVASPDGARIYALGVDPLNGETGASRGVFVFDATTLDQVDHWAPTADLVSLAINSDGEFVYVAGDSGRTATGVASEDEASITVYATADGSVRLIAGRLGSDSVFFPGATVR